jgi:ABC-type sugar transport system substrate-binding protein
MPGTVGLFLMNERNGHQLANRDAAAAAARDHGLELHVSFADGLAAQQSQDVIRFLHAGHEGRRCVVIMPVSDVDAAQASDEQHPLQKLAARVVARGVGWIVLNRDAEAHVAALQASAPEVPVGLVTPDQTEIGRIQAAQFRTLLPRGGRLLYVIGNPFVSSTRDRRAGMLEAVAGAGFSVDEVDGYWVADRARDAVLKWLTVASRRDAWPDLVGCQNDEMARGVRAALIEAARVYARPSLATVPITGCDGLPDEGQRWVAEKMLAATILMPTTADVAIHALARAWQTGRRLPPKTVVDVSPFPAASVR